MNRAVALTLMLIAGCTGSVVDGPVGPGTPGAADHRAGSDPASAGDGSSDPTKGDLGSTRAALCSAETRDRKGPRLLRRLTKSEFDATVRAVFGFDPATWTGSDLPPDPAAPNGFTNQADLLLVGDGVAEKLLATAEGVADLVITEPQLSRLVPCASIGDDACAASFLDTLGKRLYRRPLSSDEHTRYLELRNTVAAEQGDFVDWVRWATVAMLSSPHVIYRSELGDAQADGTYALSGYERATALAYTFTGAPPDDALLALAERGELDDARGVEKSARALVLDANGAVRPAFRALFRRFVSQWLGLSALENRDKDPAAVPGFSPEVRASLQREIDGFIEHVVFEEQGGMAELLSAPYTLLDRTLRDYYGYGTAAGDALELTQRPEGWGVGLLAQGALLALKSTNRDTSPTQRGHLVRGRILCFDVPPPPPVVGPLPASTGAETTRQRYEDLHTKNASCAGCHRMMDPIGFTFEHLDAGGRYRAKENGYVIDDRGVIAATRQGEEDVSVTGPVELASELVSRQDAGACFASFFAGFSFGFDQKDSACLVSSARDALARGDISLFEFVMRIATAPHFMARTDG